MSFKDPDLVYSKVYSIANKMMRGQGVMLDGGEVRSYTILLSHCFGASWKKRKEKIDVRQVSVGVRQAVELFEWPWHVCWEVVMMGDLCVCIIAFLVNWTPKWVSKTLTWFPPSSTQSPTKWSGGQGVMLDGWHVHSYMIILSLCFGADWKKRKEKKTPMFSQCLLVLDYFGADPLMHIRVLWNMCINMMCLWLLSWIGCLFTHASHLESKPNHKHSSLGLVCIAIATVEMNAIFCSYFVIIVVVQ